MQNVQPNGTELPIEQKTTLSPPAVTHDAQINALTAKKKLEIGKENEQTWIDANIDQLASVCGAVMVLSAGFLAFFLLNFLSADDKPSLGVIGILKSWASFATASAAVICLASFASLVWLSIKISRKLEQKEESTNYVISRWSIKTLEAVSAPPDLIACLDSILDNSRQSELKIKSLDDTTENNWLFQLKQKLGNDRVEEVKEILLKYTRRKTDF